MKVNKINKTPIEKSVSRQAQSKEPIKETNLSLRPFNVAINSKAGHLYHIKVLATDVDMVHKLITHFAEEHIKHGVDEYALMVSIGELVQRDSKGFYTRNVKPAFN